MNQSDLRDLLRTHPFEPFRLHMTDGSNYDVRHPDMVIAFPRSGLLALGGDLAQGLPERHIQLNLLHVVRVEKLGLPAGQGNGQG